MFLKLVISIRKFYFQTKDRIAEYAISKACKLWASLYFCNSNIKLCYRFILKILKQK